MATYSGWTNYQTWCVKLWIDNEEGSQRYWEDEAQRAFLSAGKDKDTAKYALADQLKDELEEAKPEVPGMWSDLLTNALAQTNWQEIAEAMIEDAAEGHDDEDEDSEDEEASDE